ncbi:hypothetical protein THAPSDRAFT_262734, partial [Thalassiosira pseudonana CCMP1335]
DTTSLVATPSEFHSQLCHKIRHAKDRVVLASLYIGSTIQCKEDELLQALQITASNPNVQKIQVLLDANRAMRKVSYTMTTATNSNKHSAQFHERTSVFLFQVKDERLCSILPSPLDEVAGVFHIKAYIVDNELILSGANLSEEYFTNRLDRYMLFTNGEWLVDFYANLCEVLSSYSIRYKGEPENSPSPSFIFSSQDEQCRKEQLESSLMKLFDGSKHSNESNDSKDTIAYAIPTFQMPNSFLQRPLNLPSDTKMTRELLLTASKYDQSASVRLSSAYLNLTPRLLSALTTFGAPYILTAGMISHGFAPKPKIKASIPEAFLTLVKETAVSILAKGGKVLMYERLGWTFHAKGVWITAGDDKRQAIGDPDTIIGSGNYGARSEDLDVESNCIIVFNDSTTD